MTLCLTGDLGCRTTVDLVQFAASPLPVEDRYDPPKRPSQPGQYRPECMRDRDALFALSLDEEPPKRVELLRLIPSCPASTLAERDREQVWKWLVNSATSALGGDCTVAVDHNTRVRKVDLDFHQSVWSLDRLITGCVEQAKNARP